MDDPARDPDLRGNDRLIQQFGKWGGCLYRKDAQISRFSGRKTADLMGPLQRGCGARGDHFKQRVRRNLRSLVAYQSQVIKQIEIRRTGTAICSDSHIDAGLQHIPPAVRRMTKVAMCAGAPDHARLALCKQGEVIVITVIHMCQQRGIIEHAEGSCHRHGRLGEQGNRVLPLAEFIPDITKDSPLIQQKLSFLRCLGQMRCQGQFTVMGNGKALLVTALIHRVGRMGCQADAKAIRRLMHGDSAFQKYCKPGACTAQAECFPITDDAQRRVSQDRPCEVKLLADVANGGHTEAQTLGDAFVYAVYKRLLAVFTHGCQAGGDA